MIIVKSVNGATRMLAVSGQRLAVSITAPTITDECFLAFCLPFSVIY